MKKILVANGVNLDLLGKRPQHHYGDVTQEDIKSVLNNEKEFMETSLRVKIDITFFQTNAEHDYLNKLSENWDGAVLNPAAWTHTSLALADRLESLSLPFVEVHLSNLLSREDFRQRSYSAKYSLGVICGFGINSYKLGLRSLVEYLEEKKS